MAGFGQDEQQISDALRYLAGESRGAGLNDLGEILDCVAPDRPFINSGRDGLIDLDALYTFVVVAQARTFTAAAERLGITQAAVSFQIGRLEEHLGTRLFERGARGAALLEAGQQLMVYAQAMLHLAQAARRAITPREPVLSRRPAASRRYPAAQAHAPQALAGE